MVFPHNKKLRDDPQTTPEFYRFKGTADRLGLAGGDEAHLVDLVGVAAAGQVVDGSV